MYEQRIRIAKNILNDAFSMYILIICKLSWLAHGHLNKVFYICLCLCVCIYVYIYMSTYIYVPMHILCSANQYR